jgi:hypothetical protein
MKKMFLTRVIVLSKKKVCNIFLTKRDKKKLDQGVTTVEHGKITRKYLHVNFFKITTGVPVIKQKSYAPIVKRGYKAK